MNRKNNSLRRTALEHSQCNKNKFWGLEDPIHDAPFDISEGHGVSGLLCFQYLNLNREDPIHDAPSDLSEGHGVSGLSWFQLNKSRRSNT